MEIKYGIIRSKRKTLVLEITADGSLIVRAPMRVNRERIEKAIIGKSDWIEKKMKKFLARKTFILPRKYIEGEKFLFLGQAYPLKVVRSARPALKLEDNRFLISQAALKNARAYFAKWYTQRSREIFGQRVSHYTGMLGLKCRKLKITQAKKRWGSCSSLGNICFSWKLVMAPQKIIDYVVVHEVIHLDEKNHSKQFWKKVKSAFPDYKISRNWLKENGHLLSI